MDEEQQNAITDAVQDALEEQNGLDLRTVLVTGAAITGIWCVARGFVRRAVRRELRWQTRKIEQ